MKKKIVLVAMALLLALASVAPVMAGPPDKGLGQGWQEYATVKVDWDGNPSHQGDWNVYAGPYYVVLHPSYTVGQFVTGCSACLEMIYTFRFVANTLQFDEIYVDTVVAYPQTHHVVLHMSDDGTYTGSITARYDYGGTRMDVIQYTVVTTDGAVTGFHYDEVEYIHL